jgi:hypothetical protein
MNQARRAALLERWSEGQTVYEPEPEPLSRLRVFDPIKRWDRHAPSYNYILDGRIRITPVGRFHWDEPHKVWVGFGERWNRFAKTWGEPQWFVCREFECEGNNLTEL